MTSGFHVCLVGPDGAGKTTICDLLKDELIADGHQVKRLVPRPDWFHKVSPSTFDYHRPHAEKPRSPLKSMVQMIKKLVFYTLRRASSRETNTVYLEERGWLDQAVDHLRYRIHHDTVRFPELTHWLVGRPDLTVVLGGDAEVIAARKEELEVDEVARQLNRWEKLINSSPKQSLILETTDLEIEETVEVIKEALAQGRKLAQA